MQLNEAASGSTSSSSSSSSSTTPTPSVFHPAHVVLPSSSRLSLQPQQDQDGLFFTDTPRPPVGVLARSPRTRTRRKERAAADASRPAAVQDGTLFYAARAPQTESAPPLSLHRKVHVVKGKVIVDTPESVAPTPKRTSSSSETGTPAPAAQAAASTHTQPAKAQAATPAPAPSSPAPSSSSAASPTTSTAAATTTTEQPTLQPAFMPVSTSASVTSTASPPPTSPVVPAAAAARKPAWGAPRSWAALAAPSSSSSSIATPPNGTPITSSPQRNGVPNGKGASALVKSATAISAGAGKTTHTQSKMEVLQQRLRSAECCFTAPLTAPRGMINKGNFCFANAILQVLVYCAPFTNLFALVAQEVPPDFANSTPLMEAVIHFLREFAPVPNGTPLPGPSAPHDVSSQSLQPGESNGSSSSEPFVPEFVYDAMRLTKRFDTMRRGHQEDAEEFLGFLLDTLHEELLVALRRLELRAGAAVEEEAEANVGSERGSQVGEEERVVKRPVSPEQEGWMEVGTKGKVAFTRTTATSDSPITRIFGGKLRSVLRTPGAKDSVTLEPYQPLQLDIAPAHVRSVADALRNFCQPEQIPGVWSPARGAQVDATKSVSIDTLPPVLVLHLKRFVYDGGEVLKDSKELSLALELEIDSDVISPARRGDVVRQYKLFGVVYHHGRYASGGHYTVDVLRQDASQWLHIDDVLWTPCAPPGSSAPSASGTATPTPASKATHDGVPYLLFYARVEPDATSRVNGAPATAAAAGSASATHFQALASSAPSTPPRLSPAKLNGYANGHANGGFSVVGASSSPKVNGYHSQHTTAPSSPSLGKEVPASAPVLKRVVPGAAPSVVHVGTGKKGQQQQASAPPLVRSSAR